MCQCLLPPSAQVMPCNALTALPSFALGRGGGCETLHELSRKDFSCGLRSQSTCKWSMPCSASGHLQQWGLVSFVACCEFLSWDVATHPSQQILPGDIHHHVRGKPSLAPFYGSEEKDTSREGRNSSTCLSVTITDVFFQCVTQGEHPPHPCAMGTKTG